MKWKFCVPKSPIPIYYLAKLFGLAPFTLKEGKLHPATFLVKLHSIVYAVFDLIAISAILFTRNEANSQVNLSTSTSLKFNIKLTTITINHVLAAFVLFAFVLMRDKFVCIGNKLCTINNELRDLGVKEDHGKYFRSLFMKAVMINGIFCTLLIAVNYSSLYSRTFPSILNIIMRCISCNAILIYVLLMDYIKQRFGLVTDRMYNTFEAVRRDKSLLRPVGPTVFVVSNTTDNEPNAKDISEIDRVQKIEALHLELSELVDQTTQCFGAPLLAHICSRFVNLLLSSYWVYRSILNASNVSADEFYASYILPSWQYVIWATVTTAELFVIAYAVASTCKQGNAMNSVLIEVWNIYKPTEIEIRNEFLMFSLQLMHKPLAVSAFGFFNLDYSYVYNIFCAVVTYFIVMVQLGASL